MDLTQTQQHFRESMARMGAAVNLITTDGPAGRHGFVATAVCSVTDQPPTILICVNTSAFAHDAFVENGHVCVNILAAQHQELSGVFARYVEGVDRFAHGDWVTLKTGCLALKDANAALDCTIASVQQQGSHSVMFCSVKAVHLPAAPNPGLVYFGRNYHHLDVE